jgi:predicted TIM-barrel fold metal-dependent hydrolase
MAGTTAEGLLEEIQQIEIIDTHEHLMNRDVLSNMGFNVFQAMAVEYIRDDLFALGMDVDLLLERSNEPEALLDEVLPFLRQTQNTTYCQAFFCALRDLHGLADGVVDGGQLRDVSEKIRAAYERPDWYSRVIREKCNIKYTLRDLNYMVADEDFIKPVLRMDEYLILRHRNRLERWIERGAPIFVPRTTEAVYGEKVRTLDDYLALMEADFEQALAFGAVAIKVGIAYDRTLQFDKISIDDANRVFALPDEKTTAADIKRFQDFIMFRIIESAGEKGLPVQIHTGLLAEGRNTLANSNPLHLNNIFIEFPHVQFDVFHGAFPFTGEIGSLALMFPNVYLDTCWLPLISYASFTNALSEWLSYVPAGKFLWGGDCACAEGVYGAVHMVRRGLAEVLGTKVDYGVFDREFALEVARALLHDNACRLFNL